MLLPSQASVWMIGAILAAALAFAGWLAATATYARKETVAGWLTPDAGTLRAIANWGGLSANPQSPGALQ